jgi:hypothetical protein
MRNDEERSKRREAKNLKHNSNFDLPEVGDIGDYPCDTV